MNSCVHFAGTLSAARLHAAAGCAVRRERAFQAFDGSGMRVKKSTGTLYWRGTSGAVFAESDLSGNITSEYIYFAGRKAARRDSSGNVYFMFADHLGSTHTVTNSTGTPCYDASFTPCGEQVLNPTVASTCAPNYRFTGYELDPETATATSIGNYYAFARYYSPRLGRFLSPDPAGHTSVTFSDPQSFNSYTYVRNSSLNLVDPSGRLFEESCYSFWVKSFMANGDRRRRTANSAGGPPIPCGFGGGGGNPCAGPVWSDVWLWIQACIQ